MAFDLSQIGTVAAQIAANPKLQAEFWSNSIIEDSRDKCPLKDFVGGEDSGMPICEAKRAAIKNGGQKINMTVRASVLGQGVKGSAELKSKTSTLNYGSFNLTVDLRRFAISEEQLVKYFTQSGASESDRAALIYGLCRDWWTRTYTDDMQITLRNRAIYAADQPNVLRIGNGASKDEITLADTIDSDTIEDGANNLIGLGAMPMSLDTDASGSDVPEFLLYGPREFLDPLKNEQKYREAVLAASQGKGNDAVPFKGRYPQWDNNLVFKHNIVRETGPVRLGSPLAPYALLGVALANGSATSITGGGSWNADGTLTDATLFDFFSYFPAYPWTTYSTETFPTDSATHYAIIYNVSGANRGKYEIVSYVAAGNLGVTLTVTREVDADGQKTDLTAAGRYSNVHPSGSLVIPCNKLGVPINYALHMGGNALMVGKGGIEAQQIEHGDDFKAVGTENYHVKGYGIQTIAGYEPYTNADGIFPNFVLVEGAAPYRRLNLVDLSS